MYLHLTQRADPRKYSITNETLFCVAWFLFTSTLILNSAIFYVNNRFLEHLFKYVRYIAYIICLIKVFRQKHEITKLPFLIVLAVTFILSGFGSKNLTYPLYGIILLGSINTRTNRIIWLTGMLQGVYLSLIIILSQIGIIEDYVFDPTTRARHGLGFNWTTTGPMLFLYFCLCIIYLKKERFTFGLAFFLEAINVWLFYMTDSKMAFGLLTFVLLFCGVQNINKKRWRWFSKYLKVYILWPFLMLALTLLLVKKYNWYEPRWALLDSLLSYRLGLMQNAYNTYGIHLLGQSIHWVGFDYKTILSAAQETYNYVDNSYLQIAFNNGLIFLMVVLCIYSYGIYKAGKNGDYYLVFIYLVILVLSMTEPRLMNFAYNPFPLIALGYFPSKLITSLINKKRFYRITISIK